MDILKKLTEEFPSVREDRAKNIIALIDEGNTIPFIARYRKEMTGSCDDQVLREFNDRLLYLRNLEKRKEEVAKSITDQGKMTEEIQQALRLGGNIVVDWETAQQCDPNFFDNLVGSVYCDEQRNAKDFDPEKVAPQCMPTTPAVINWLGKHGWTLIQFVPIGDTDAVLTKPWSKID